MIPTLRVGDCLCQNIYGYSRYSFLFGLVPVSGRMLGGEPERGDVVVFRKPGDESIDYICSWSACPVTRFRWLRHNGINWTLRTAVLTAPEHNNGSS